MTGNINISVNSKSDSTYLVQIGEFIRRSRLDVNMTQANLADLSGIGRSTIVAIEKGNSITLLNLVQILRTLGKLSVLEEMQYKERISPLLAAKLTTKSKGRAKGIELNKAKKTTDW
ncbi:MAG: helix-turn-helix domain-containing protein [Pedobacter sp.]|nr:MAG: helix-turn-helix domain-containing protein [Pedobacter sp.]